MKRVRVLVVPGHFQETYNNLVVEAAASGLPAVSMGIGALAERVLHGETGWVASSVREMGHAIVQVLSDEALWRRYHLACLKHPDLVSWDERAKTWEWYMQDLLTQDGARRV
jgi:glycosyltransferase involved in cell wall biosynthesis